MKKLTLLAVSVLLVLALVGCASTKAPIKESNETIVAQNEKVLGKNGVPQPDWVGTSREADGKLYVSGYGKMSKRENSITRAQVNAKNSIAQYTSENISRVITNYANDAGSDSDTQTYDAMTTVSVQRAEALITGIMQEDMWEDAEGGINVLMSVPLENVKESWKKAIEETSKDSTVFKDSAAAEKANEKMAEAINQYFADKI